MRKKIFLTTILVLLMAMLGVHLFAESETIERKERHQLVVLPAKPAAPAWKAGLTLTDAEVRERGIDNCFRVESISDAVFARMRGRSFPDGAAIRRSDLRYLRLLHYGGDGRIHTGEMVCNKAIAADLIAIFRRLYEKRYPIERMVLIDDYEADDERSMAANNTSCFCYRQVAGSKKLSKHSAGLAVDINPRYNPYCRTVNGRRIVRPSNGRPYADRSKRFVNKIDRTDLCYQLFTAHGFRWGGAWRTLKDYQHFEY